MSCRGVRGRGGVCAARQRTTPSIFVNGRAAVVCQSDGERRIRLFSVSRMRLSAEKRVVRMGWLGPRVAGLRSRRRNRTLAVERICGRKKDCLEKSEVRCGGARGYEAHPESGRSPPDVHCNPSASPGTLGPQKRRRACCEAGGGGILRQAYNAATGRRWRAPEDILARRGEGRRLGHRGGVGHGGGCWWWW